MERPRTAFKRALLLVLCCLAALLVILLFAQPSTREYVQSNSQDAAVVRVDSVASAVTEPIGPSDVSEIRPSPYRSDARDATLTVRSRDSSGAVVPHVVFGLFRTSRNDDMEPIADCKTDDKGLCVIEGLKPGEYGGKGLRGATRLITVATSDITSDFIVCDGVRVYGFVTDETGDLIAGANIFLVHSWSTASRRGSTPDATTNAWGEFSLVADPSGCRLAVDKPGYAEVGTWSLERSSASSDIECNLKLRRQRVQLQVTVVGHDGSPIRDADVSLATTYSGRQRTEGEFVVFFASPRSARTDSQGLVEFECAPGNYGIQVIARGLAPIERVVYAPDAGKQEVTIQTSEGASATIAIVDARTKERTGGDLEVKWKGRVIAKLRSSGVDVVRVKSLPVGDVQFIAVSGKDIGDRVQTLGLGDNHVEILMDPVPSISGSVTASSGEPLDGYRIAVRAMQTARQSERVGKGMEFVKTASDGSFEARGLSKGKHCIEVRDPTTSKPFTLYSDTVDAPASLQIVIPNEDLGQGDIRAHFSTESNLSEVSLKLTRQGSQIPYAQVSKIENGIASIEKVPFGRYTMTVTGVGLTPVAQVFELRQQRHDVTFDFRR